MLVKARIFFIFYFLQEGMRKRGGGAGRQGDREKREREEKWVGGRTYGATRNSYQLIIIKKALADAHGKLAWFFGGWQFKAETSDMTPRDC